MESARQWVVRRRQIDRVERRRRRERDEVGRVRVVREDDGLARFEILSQGAQLARLQQRAGTGADGADTVELLLVDDPRELLTEMERLGPRRKDRRAFGAEGRRGLVVVGDGVEAREAGVGGAPEDDRADRELHLVQLLLDVARATATKEDQERAHTCDASSLPRIARSSSRTSRTRTRALRTAPARTRSSADGTSRRTAIHTSESPRRRPATSPGHRHARKSAKKAKIT